MSILDAALQYAGRGWRVFRLTGYKTPLKGTHGFKDATCDPPTLEAWWRETPWVNVGLATGLPADGGQGGVPNLVVLDADGPGGLDQLRAIARAWAPLAGGLPPTLVAQTRRGFHFYFTLPPGIRLRSRNQKRDKGADGLDIKADGGYVVLPPSTNKKTGFVYAWTNGEPIADMPGWLIAWCREQSTAASPNQEPARGGQAVGDSFGGFPGAERPPWLVRFARGPAVSVAAVLATMRRHELPDLLAALKTLPADPGYDRWFEIGAAIHDFAPGSDGLAIFRAWSRTSRRHADEADLACERKWVEYGKPKPGKVLITKASIYAWADEAKRAIDNESFARNNVAIPLENKKESGAEAGRGNSSYFPGVIAGAPMDPPAAGESGGGDPFHGAFDQGVAGEETKAEYINGHAFEGSAFGSGSLENPLITLNNKHAVIADVGGKCLVLAWTASKVDPSLKVPSFQTFKTFSERYANQYVTVKHEKPNGEIVEEPKQIGGHWLKWPKRRSFEGIDLVPGAGGVLPGNVLNLWTGFAVMPAAGGAGGWPLMKAHICNVLAAGNGEAAAYIFKFAAWCVQHPGERAEVALVFRGGKGSGKGTFANALKRIFGQHGLQIFSSKHLVGSFNGHLRSCLLLFADEAFWAGDKAGESVLKGMLTEAALMIEQKGIDATPWVNRLKVIMAANAEWVVPASHDERRYAVFSVSGDRIGDDDYFEALYNELNGAGLAAMLHDLLAVELGKWHPRKIVHTAGLQEQKAISLTPLQEWYVELLENGALAFVKGKPNQVLAGTLLDLANRHLPASKSVTATALGRFLSLQENTRIHTENGNYWKFPDLLESRQKWEKRYRGWRWPNELDVWNKK